MMSRLIKGLPYTFLPQIGWPGCFGLQLILGKCVVYSTYTRIKVRPKKPALSMGGDIMLIMGDLLKGLQSIVSKDLKVVLFGPRH